MTHGETLYFALVLASFATFAGSLSWVAWWSSHGDNRTARERAAAEATAAAPAVNESFKRAA